MVCWNGYKSLMAYFNNRLNAYTMKKRNLNNLKLNKTVISNLNLNTVYGGKLGKSEFAGQCPDDPSRATICESQGCPVDDTCENSFAPGCVCSENVC